MQPPWEKKNDVWSLTRPVTSMSHLFLETFTWALVCGPKSAVHDDRLAVGAQGALQRLDAHPGVAELEAAQPVRLGEQDRPVPGADQEPVLDAALEVAGELLDRGLGLRAVEAVDGHRTELRVVEHALQRAHGPAGACRARSPGTTAACGGTGRRASVAGGCEGGEATAAGPSSGMTRAATTTARRLLIAPIVPQFRGARGGGTSLRACPLPLHRRPRPAGRRPRAPARPGALGARPVAVRRESELAECDGLVLPGGESTTMAKLARIFDLLDPLRDARSRAGCRSSAPARG